MQARELVYSGPAKNDLICSLFVIGTKVLSVLDDGLLLEFLDNLLNGVLEESLEGGDLLGNEAILLEVAIDNFPTIVLIDSVHVYIKVSLGQH